jgi:hypothetical protein
MGEWIAWVRFVDRCRARADAERLPELRGALEAKGRVPGQTTDQLAVERHEFGQVRELRLGDDAAVVGSVVARPEFRGAGVDRARRSLDRLVVEQDPRRSLAIAMRSMCSRWLRVLQPMCGVRSTLESSRKAYPSPEGSSSRGRRPRCARPPPARGATPRRGSGWSRSLRGRSPVTFPTGSRGGWDGVPLRIRHRLRLPPWAVTRCRFGHHPRHRPEFPEITGQNSRNPHRLRLPPWAVTRCRFGH